VRACSGKVGASFPKKIMLHQRSGAR
jgi:hypothetical protein